MAADVLLPSNTAQTFERVTNYLSQDEAKDIILDVKKRFPGKLDHLSNDNFTGHLQGLYKLGDITKEDLSLIPLITAKAEKSNKIQAIIEKHQPQQIRKFVGRAKDVEIVRRILTMPRVPGVNLHGESGVGKTTLAQEVAKVLKDFKLITIDLRGIVETETVYFLILERFNLQAWDKDVGRLFSHLKSIDEKTLLILDNVEQLISKDAGDARAQFIEFLSDIAASQACGNGSLKLLLTSREQLKDKTLRQKMFSERKVEPFDKLVSKDFLSPTNPGFSKEVEDANLLKIAKLCKNIPYLLKAAKRMLREDFRKPSEVLERLNTQLRKGVPEKYACMAAQFDFIPNDDLKELVVKLSLLQQPFSVSTAMKIAGISSQYNASIDLKLLLRREVISLEEAEGKIKADGRKHKYEIHDQFHEFVQKYLCESQPHFKEIYQEGQKQFFIYFSGKLSKLSHLMDREFVKVYTKLEKNRANFEHVIDISKSRSEVFEVLLHLDQPNEAALIRFLFEALKDVNERKKMYSCWAEIAETSENWLASAQLRCWQALEEADLEGTHDANKALAIAEESLRKAEERQQEQLQQLQQQLPQQLQLEQQHHHHHQQQQKVNSTKSLFLHARGKIKWLHASNLLDEKEKRVMIQEGIRDLEEALQLSEVVTKGEARTMEARIINLIGNCYMELNDPDSAEGFYMRALEMKRNLVGSDDHWDMAMSYNQIAQVHERRGMNMEAKFLGSFFNKTKITREYEEAVAWTKKALDLEERLGVSDTGHMAAFQRNLANCLIGLKKYDEALKYANSCYENRKQRLGEHPETVRILYLTGIIHEWREDIKKACETYEEAFEMEEALPEYNHSVRRLDIRRRLKVMYKKLKLKNEEADLKERIREIEEREKETGTIGENIENIAVAPDDYNDVIITPAEILITVNQEGGKYNNLVDGFLLDFPPECVTEATRIRCKASSSKSNLPSPNDSTESLVSSIVELGPDSIQLKRPLIMRLLHCGVSESQGYETKVKVFNKELGVWEEVEELLQASQPPENIQSSFIEVQLSKLSAVAVVSRLITTTFEVPISGCGVTSPILSDVTVTFPEGAVDKTNKGGLQVIPIPEHVAKDSEAIPCPVLLFSGFNNVVFSKPVHITVPLALHSKCTDVRVPRLDDVGTSPFLWVDITTDNIIVQTNEKTTLEVKRFCGFPGREEEAFEKYLDVPTKRRKIDHRFYRTGETSSFHCSLSLKKNLEEHELPKVKGDLQKLAKKEILPKEHFKLAQDPVQLDGLPQEQGSFCAGFQADTQDRHTSEVRNCYCRDNPTSRDVYRMKSHPRGLMIIINIRKFVVDPSLPDHEKLQKELVERTGSEKDVDQLEELFGGYLQFKVHTLKPEKKRFELLTELKGIANKPEYKHVDCFALCIMSHGKGSKLYNYDGRTIKISAIYNMLCNSQCENFRGKPKLYFIQACRCHWKDEKPPIVEGRRSATEVRSDSIPRKDSIRRNDMADMLLAYSSFEDYPSFRHPEEGSLFIQRLVSVLKEYAGNEEISTLMKKVRNKVYTIKPDQIPTETGNLRKELYLLPEKMFK